jgi:hypothetical protein
MARFPVRWFFACLIVLILTASAEGAPARYSMVRLPGRVLPALAKATVIRSKPGSAKQPITLTIVLRRDDQKGFERYLHELSDPPLPRQHLHRPRKAS